MCKGYNVMNLFQAAGRAPDFVWVLEKTNTTTQKLWCSILQLSQYFDLRNPNCVYLNLDTHVIYSEEAK